MMAALTVGALALPDMGAMALDAVAVRGQPVQAAAGHRLVAALAGDPFGLGRRMGLVASRAGKAHRSVLGEARRMDSEFPVAAQAVAAGGPQRCFHRKEVVAGEAVELLHARNIDGVIAVTALAARHGRLEAVDAAAVALHAGDLLLDGVHAMSAGGADRDPLLVVAQMTGGAGSDLEGRMLGGPRSSEEAPQHGEALFGRRVVALLAGDAAVLSAAPDGKLRTRLVAGGAEARVLLDVGLQPREADEASEDQRGAERDEQPEAHATRTWLQRACRRGRSP